MFYIFINEFLLVRLYYTKNSKLVFNFTSVLCKNFSPGVLNVNITCAATLFYLKHLQSFKKEKKNSSIDRYSFSTEDLSGILFCDFSILVLLISFWWWFKFTLSLVSFSFSSLQYPIEGNVEQTQQTKKILKFNCCQK